MNESDSNQLLSEFVDDELRGPAQDRIVDALYGSPELRRAWARYHLIGDAVRKVGPVPGADTIADNVSAALCDEQVVHFKPRSRRSRLHALSGLAIAAAVASVAILGIHSLDDGGAQSPRVAGDSQPELAVADSAPATEDSPASRFVSMAVPSAGTESNRLQWSGVAPDAEARLNVYLLNHNAYAGNDLRGVLPYVRIVGYQSPAGDDR